MRPRFLACVLLACSALAVAGEAPDPIPVILVPIRQATLSAEVTSTVSEIGKELGQSFAEKAPLIVLDRTIHAANRDKARAQEVSARAQLQAKESLLADGQASATEVETARMNLAVARSELVVAEKHLSACQLLAPFAGSILKVSVNRHELVQSGQPLVEIVDDHILRAQFLVPAALAARVKVGLKLRLRLQDGAEVAATVSHIGRTVDPASSTVKVYAEVENAAGTLQAGIRGMVEIP